MKVFQTVFAIQHVFLLLFRLSSFPSKLQQAIGIFNTKLFSLGIPPIRCIEFSVRNISILVESAHKIITVSA